MKKSISTLIASAIALSASAVIDGDGYYRVQNYTTGRYIYVLDNKGSLNFQATTAELGAIELWKDHGRTISDPATIIYVKDLDGRGRSFDLQTQGTGVKSMIDYPVTIYRNPKTDIYSIYGSNSGMVRYIGDATKSNSDQGYVTSNGNGDYHRWYFHPVTSDGDNYFGVTPEFQEGDEYFGTLYADFAFTAYSEGVTPYFVCSIQQGVVYIAEVDGTVPRSTPVIIKCSSADPSDNRLNVGGEAQTLSENRLKGVYFNNTTLRHKNLTPNDPATMRVLGRLSDGSLGFVTSTEEYLPRNKAYLPVPQGTPAELRLEYASAAIDDVIADRQTATVSVDGLTVKVDGPASAIAEIFSITGQLVATGTADGAPIALPSPGVYIVRCAATVTKIIVH